jgi:hypothetical protein
LCLSGPGQLLAQPVKEFIKRLKPPRLAAADVFGRATPGVLINRVAIRPQADDECGFANRRLHGLEGDSFLAQRFDFWQVNLFVEGHIGSLSQNR